MSGVGNRESGADIISCEWDSNNIVSDRIMR